MSLKDIQQDQEAILRILLSEQSVLGIAILQDGVLKYINDAISDITGYSNDEIMNWKPNEFTKVIHPEDLPFVLDQARKKQAGDPDVIPQYSFRLITKSGSIKWVAIYSKTIEYKCRFADFVTYTDITDQILTETALKTSEEQLQVQYRGLPVSTITWQYVKNDFILVNYNEAAMAFTEQKIADLLGKKASEVYQDSPDNLEDLSRCYKEKGIIKREGLFRMKTTGKHTYQEVTFAYVPPDLVLIHSKDISEQKKTEQALQASEERYQTLFENARDAIGITTPDGKYVDFNPAALQLFGYSREELLELDVQELYVDLNDRLRFQQQLESNGAVTDFEVKLQKKDGTVIDCLNTATVLRDKSGKIWAYHNITRDITARKRAETILKNREQRYRALFEQTNDAVFIISPDHSHYIEINQKAADMLGYELTELVGMSPMKIMVPSKLLENPKRLDELQKQQVLPVYQSTFRRKDGSEIPVELNLAIVYDTEGNLLHIQSIARDIRERKKAEEQQQLERERIQKYLDVAGVILVALDQNHRVSLINRKGCEVLGYTEAEILGNDWMETFLPTEIQLPAKHVFEQLMRRDVDPVEYYENPVVTKDGKERIIAWHNTLLVDDFGNRIGTLSSGEDITISKKTEDALKASEERYRLLFNKSNDAVTLHGLTPDGQMDKYLEVNDVMCERLGYTREELLNLTPNDINDPDTIGDIPKLIDQLFERKHLVFERVHVTKSGQKIPVEISSHLFEFNDQIRLLSVNRDITERKKTENALRESEERYRILFEDAPISLWEEDFSAVKQYLDQLRQQGVTNFRTFFEQNPEAIVHCVTQVNVIDVNKATMELYEAKTKENLFGDLIGQAFTKESFNDYKEGIIAFTEGKMVFETETVRKTLNGNEIHLVVRWSCPPGYEDTWEKVFVSLLNITDRKKAEDALQESENALRSSEERFRRLAEASFEGIVIVERLRIVDANHNFAWMFGYRLAEIIGMNLLDLIAPESRESAQSHIHAQSEMAYEGIGLRKDGKKFPFEAHGRSTLFQGRPARVSALRDITAQRQMDEARKELEEQQAEFVSVTSHELRTPLTAIRGYTELLEQKINEITQEQQDQCYQAIRRNIKRLEGLISSVSTLGQLERGLFNLNLKKMDICAFLMEALQPYQSFLDNQLEVQYKPKRDIFIDGDSDRLLQVLNNLLENAVKHTSKTDRHICVELKILPQTVQIQIVDNGAGIDPENLDRIFEAFVSIPTNFSAIGSGIGLYLARKITDAHDGSLIGHSEGKGRGSTFTLELPRRHDS